MGVGGRVRRGSGQKEEKDHGHEVLHVVQVGVERQGNFSGSDDLRLVYSSDL